MKILIVKDSQAGGKEALKLYEKAAENGDKVFGLATGSTPESTYLELIESNLDFKNKISINLDEYVGLNKTNSKSYYYYMQTHLFNQKPFAKSYIPDGMAEEDFEINRYNEVLKNNPIDLQLLGIGENGHIGFNEPGSSFDTLTRKVSLTKSTIEANARFFKNSSDVPRYAYSMGIGSIMKAKKIILEAYGSKKATAIFKTIKGPITTDVPASILQKHPDVTFILDEKAAQLLK